MENIVKFIIGATLITVLFMFISSEISSFISPLIHSVDQDDIDMSLKTNKDLVKRESDASFKTLKGEDKNKNGIRDDPERMLEYYYDFSKKYYYDSSKLDKTRYNKYYKKSISHLLEKMQGLTKHEDAFDIDIYSSDFEFKESKGLALKRYKYLDDYLAVEKYTKCLFKMINDNERVWSGNGFLHIIRSQMNTKNRRMFFGEQLLFQSKSMFESNIVTKPRNFNDYSSEFSRLKDKLKIKSEEKRDKIKKCAIEELI